LWAQQALDKQLQQEEGFNSYAEIQQWLQEKLGITTTYKNVHDLVHYRMKAKPKVARPYSASQNQAQAEDYKKKLSENLAMIAWYVVTLLGVTRKVRFFCQDETRIGLKTISGRKITARGVKPKAKVQWQFQATWLYGIVEPATGESFFYEFSHLNTDCFQIFLDLVSAQFADSVIIMQVDQAGCHRAKRLRLPNNIILIFQPAHSPELNPIERVWLHLKQGLRFALPKNMDELRLLLKNRLSEMTKSVIASLVGRDSILHALSVASLL
jgi:hypothetical protein